MDEIIPTINLPLSHLVDRNMTGCETVVNDFIKQAQEEKRIRTEAINRLQVFMKDNETSIMKFVDKYNTRHQTGLRFQNILEIAIGWDVDDINSLVKLSKKRKIREFTHRLLSY